MADDLIKIEGLRELDAKLAQLPTKVGFKVLRSAMMAATGAMFKAARSNAEATGIKGFDAGATAAAMARWVKKEAPTKTVLYIGPKNKNKKALALWNAKHGRNVTRLRHFHLLEFGSEHGPAQPFLRPAFAAHARSAAESFKGNVEKQLAKVWNKPR